MKQLGNDQHQNIYFNNLFHDYEDALTRVTVHTAEDDPADRQNKTLSMKTGVEARL